MKLENKNFPEYMATAMKDIPEEDLRPMLMELCCNAMFFMGTENDSATTARLVSGVMDLILSDHYYKFMPLHLIIETFHKGSAGELGGTTRFGLRNVNIWLFSAKDKYIKLISENKSREADRIKVEEERSYKQIKNRASRFGEAFYRKIEWCQAGLLSPDDYDRCTLDKIVDMLNQGHSARDLMPKHILGR